MRVDDVRPGEVVLGRWDGSTRGWFQVELWHDDAWVSAHWFSASGEWSTGTPPSEVAPLPGQEDNAAEIIQGLLGIIRSDWIRGCEGLAFDHGSQCPKETSERGGRLCGMAEEYLKERGMEVPE